MNTAEYLINHIGYSPWWETTSKYRNATNNVTNLFTVVDKYVDETYSLGLETNYTSYFEFMKAIVNAYNTKHNFTPTVDNIYTIYFDSVAKTNGSCTQYCG